MRSREYDSPDNHDNDALTHTIKQACARLNIGRSLLNDLIDRREIRAIRLGSRVLIPESELQKLIASRLCAAGSKGAAG